jgi:TatD DNase family protein
MMQFDTHFHLDLFTYPKKIIKAIEEQKIYTIAVTNLPKVFFNTKKLCEGSKYVRPALGYHPELAFKFNDQFDLFCDLLDQTRYIGEIGIDNLRKSSQDLNCQKQIFEKIISVCAQKENKILSVHSRRAEKQVLSIIGDSFPGKTILHWYSGSIGDLETAISYGYYFSVNSSMVQSKNGVNIINRIPLDRLLIESDSPFIGVDKESEMLPDYGSTIKGVSTIKDVLQTDLKSILNQNFQSLLSH